MNALLINNVDIFLNQAVRAILIGIKNAVGNDFEICI